MAGKPKPLFWIVVVCVVCGLIYYAAHRANSSLRTNTGKNGEDIDTSRIPSGERLDISFYSSSAKSDWIDAMVKDFNRSGQTVGDRIIIVKAVHGNSGEQLDDLKAGRIQPDIWSPGDESWLQLASSYWQNVKQKKLFDKSVPLVNIPLVIAMWEPMAKILGYPGPIGWKDIEAVASNPQGWAAFGHPEWGKFRWGHAHPDANSGFLTILSEIYAILNKNTGLSSQDLSKKEVISFLQDFEGAVEHYGLSNTWIDTYMRTKGPAYLSATVQYENTIIQSNEKYGNSPFKLVAIYPKEGNFWNTHPAVILDETWMNDEKKEACNKFIEFLIDKETQKKALKMGLRPIRNDISMESPFDEAHGVAAHVDAGRAFQVPDEGVLQRVRDLWESVKVPATVVLILDRSGSMKGKPMDNAKLGAVQFVKSMKARDQIMAVIFNENVQPLTQLCNLKECGENLVMRLDGVFADGETALHDAVAKYYTYLMELRKKNPNRRYGILLLSDGQDTASQISRYDFLDILPRGESIDVPKIYAIAYGPEADKELLAQVANRTNARLFSSKPEDIIKTYKELSANF